MQTMITAKLNALLFISFLCFEISLFADPEPGDIFREYSYNKNIHFMIERGVYKDSVQIEIFVDDVFDAVKLEFGASYWGGHIGTSNQMFRVNNSPKYNIPHPQTPGRHYCYSRNIIGRKAQSVPINYLKKGKNTVTLYCGPQICYSFNWPHYIVYSAFLRIYYSSDKLNEKPIIELTGNRDDLHYYPSYRVLAENKDDIESIHFVGKYLDYDRAGDGRLYKWHYQIFKGKWLSTLDHSPFHGNKYECQWDNSWVPLQEKPVELAACVNFRSGLKYMTESVKDHSFNLSYPVKMFVSKDVPEAFDARNGDVEYCTIEVSDLRFAKSAMLAIASWSGATSTGAPHEVRVNGVQVGDNFGVFHDFSYDMLPLPVHLLREGTNTISFYSEYEGHSLEVLWPGPALLVKYCNEDKKKCLPSWSNYYFKTDPWNTELHFENQIFRGTITAETSTQKVLKHQLAEFVLKNNNNDLAKALDASKHRGAIARASLLNVSDSSVNFQLAFYNSDSSTIAYISEYTIFNNLPLMEIKYVKFPEGDTMFDILSDDKNSLQQLFFAVRKINGNIQFEMLEKKQIAKLRELHSTGFANRLVIMTVDRNSETCLARIIPLGVDGETGVKNLKSINSNGYEFIPAARKQNGKSHMFSSWIIVHDKGVKKALEEIELVLERIK